VDYVTLSAHKSGGPVGAAALVIRQGAPGIEPLLTGGGQEFNQRAGTENVPAIAAFAALAGHLDALLAHQNTLAAWRDNFESAVLAACPEATVIGRTMPRLANTSCIAMPQVKGETQVIAFDLEGVAVSAGSACTSGKVGRSHVLGAMNMADEVAETAVRISSGWASTEQDYQTAAAVWHKVYAKATANRANSMQGKHAA
jgi:cysteine desulfurase